VKFTDHWEEEEEDGTKILHDRERFSHELALVFANGRTQGSHPRKGSVRLAGRKKPLRHPIASSEEFASSNVSPGSGRTLLASLEKQFIWASLAIFTGSPEYAAEQIEDAPFA
jgi:hypothetical protein